MKRLKTIMAAVLLSSLAPSQVFAQAAISEPAAFQAMYPNRDVLNAGASISATMQFASTAYATLRVGDVLSHRHHRRRTSHTERDRNGRE
jgi:hypothetical protein